MSEFVGFVTNFLLCVMVKQIREWYFRNKKGIYLEVDSVDNGATAKSS